MEIIYITYDSHFRIIKETLQNISIKNGALDLRQLRTIAYSLQDSKLHGLAITGGSGILSTLWQVL